MAMQLMLSAVDAVGKLEVSNDVDDSKALAIGLGYYYGFAKLHLIGITKLDRANTIIDRSLAHLENAMHGTELSQTVRGVIDRALTSMKGELSKRPEDPFVGIGLDYLKDLYNNPSSVDFGEAIATSRSMRLLYGASANLTKDVKIV